MSAILPCERPGESLSDEELLRSGRELVRIEAAELMRAAERLGPELVRAARAICECAGRVVVVGLGKSGHIGRKIAATLASLGTPPFFFTPRRDPTGTSAWSGARTWGSSSATAGRPPNWWLCCPTFDGSARR